MDAVLAVAGGETLEQIAGAIKTGGLLAYPNGVYPQPKKRHGIRIVGYDAVAGVREFQHLEIAVDAAKLKVPIAAKFPLDQAAQVHERLAQGNTLGTWA